MRVAMWSGPRNISTAMMRSWGNRPDTAVCDEPLYAHYLDVTGLDHPGRDEILAHHETDPARVIETLLGPIPGGRAVFYQKQMAHHLTPHVDRGWLRQVESCFLIRDPAEMLTSLIKQVPEPTIESTGLPQQIEIFERVERETGRTPPVLDARDVLEDPRGMLEQLCARLGLRFTEAMLAWPPGPRDTDGVWAPHWYAAVEQSTGFKPYAPKTETVPARLRAVCAEAMTHYDRLHQARITPAPQATP